MTDTEFERAVRHGLGRAILHVERHGGSKYRNEILTACIHDQRWDRQCESPRGHYLVDLIHATGEIDHYAPLIRHALLTDADAGEYLQSVVFYLAKAGDERAKRTLYTCFERNPAWNGYAADDLLALDGIDGFVFAIRLFAVTEFHPDDAHIPEGLFREFAESVGAENVAGKVAQIIRSEPSLADYLNGLHAKHIEWRNNLGKWKSPPVPDLPTFRQLLCESENGSVPGSYGWSSDMSDETSLALAADIAGLTDEKPMVLCAYLRLFARRPFPLSPDILIPWARHEDRKIRWNAARALSNLTDDKVRALAEELSTNPSHVSAAIRLMTNNPRPDDSARLLLMTDFCTTDEMWHDWGLAFLHYAKANGSEDYILVLHRLYENTPCTNCRHGVVKHLIEQEALTKKQIEECRYDASNRIREAVG